MPESPRDRGAHLLGVELLAFDLAAISERRASVFRSCGFLLKSEAKAFHTAQQPALPMTDGDQRARHGLRIPVEAWPVGELMDICQKYTQFVRRLCGLFDASSSQSTLNMRRIRCYSTR